MYYDFDTGYEVSNPLVSKHYHYTLCNILEEIVLIDL